MPSCVSGPPPDVGPGRWLHCSTQGRTMAVKVILRQDVPSLGTTGEIKQVAPGYFRNFLLPRGLAVEATKSQIRALESDATMRAGQVAKSKERLGAVAQQLQEVTIRIP